MFLAKIPCKNLPYYSTPVSFPPPFLFFCSLPSASFSLFSSFGQPALAAAAPNTEGGRQKKRDPPGLSRTAERGTGDTKLRMVPENEDFS